MKSNTVLLYIIAITLFSLFSCTSDNVSNEDAIKTRALPNSTSDENIENASPTSISRKWEFGEDFIDLGNEGSFEAMLDGKHYFGKWGLSNGNNDERTLKLIGQEDLEGSTKESFKRTYEIINVSYERMVAIDSAGNKINFFPEE
jgi:predicted HNH restriction endonuclease